MAKHEYEVAIPIAGHAFLTVEAESEDEAVEIAMGEVTREHIEEWEALDAFHQGNVCYCPSPWQVQVTDCGEITEQPSAAPTSE
jgi:hypothetical protein